MWLYTGVMRLHFVAFTILRKACDYQNLCGWKTKCHGTEPREVTETEVDGCIPRLLLNFVTNKQLSAHLCNVTGFGIQSLQLSPRILEANQYL